MALAFVQESKNAWKEKVPDYAAIEFALRKCCTKAVSRYVSSRETSPCVLRR